MNRQTADKIMIRLPDGMRRRIKIAAATNLRGMNAEIVGALTERFGTTEEAAAGEQHPGKDAAAREAGAGQSSGA